jgi:CelD/BcsL family acetyltransferase involved in cellulose biosynthesis
VACQSAPEGRSDPLALYAYDDIATVEPEWDALVERVGAPPFLRPGWFAAWWKAFGSGRPVVLTAWRGRTLTGVLVLRRRAGALVSPTNAHTPGFGVVAEDDGVSRALVSAAFALSPHVLALDYLDGASADVEALQRGAAGAGHATLRLTIERSPYVTLADEETVARLPGSKRASNLRRLERRLRALGRLDVRVDDGRERLGDLLEEGYRLEASGWKESRGTAIRSRADTTRFYDTIARWAAERGMLRLAFLYLDEHPIAFELGLQDRSAYYLLKGGYDPVHRSFAPGILLARAMIARAAAERLTRYEFLGADESWKRTWAREDRERVLVHTFAPTLPGAIDRVAQTALLVYGKPLARRVVAHLR